MLCVGGEFFIMFVVVIEKLVCAVLPAFEIAVLIFRECS